MTSALRLESFDPVGTSATHPVTTDEKPTGYEDGYAAGLAAAEAVYRDDQAALRTEVVQSISEIVHNTEAARHSFLAAIEPLHDTLLETLLPAALAPALHAHLRDMIADARKADLTIPITLSVPPDQQTVMAAALSDLDLQTISLRPDPSLTDHAVWIATEAGETALDLDAALGAIASAMSDLKTLNDTAKEAQAHG